MIVSLFLDTDDHRYFSGEARAAIREVCEATEPEVRRLLPDLAGVVECAAQAGAFVIPETGENGTAMYPGRVNWTVNPSVHGGIVAIARSQLRATLFHELHHLVRGWVKYGNEARRTLMDAVVSEGLATAFERDFGGRSPPWGLYPQEACSWVAELLALPKSAPYYQWMFKHADGRQWIGYRAGTYIADLAVANSGGTAAELVRTPTGEVLKLAGISPG